MKYISGLIKKTGWQQFVWWLLLIGWMGLIFYMSAQDGEESAQMSAGIVDRLVKWITYGMSDLGPEKLEQLRHHMTFIVRKLAHFTEYAVLSAIAVELQHTYHLIGWRCFLPAWLGATVYAATDEIHQGFSVGRSPQLMDVCIDSAGAAFGAACLLLLLQYWKYRKGKRQI